MFQFSVLTIPILSLLSVFGIAVITDVNMIAFDITSVPEVARNMGFNESSIRGSIMRKIHIISKVGETSRGVNYTSISDMGHQTLKNISDTLGIQAGVVAAQGFLGLIPYRFKGKLVQEGDWLYLSISGFSRDGQSFNFVLKSNEDAFSGSKIIKGNLGISKETAETDTTNLVVTDTETAIKSLLDRAAEAIVDRIDPYLLARYYFFLERPTTKFTKTLPQLARCLVVLPKPQQIWPLILLGQTYHAQGAYEKAIAIYKKADQIESNFPFALIYWGEALADQGEHKSAIVQYQKVVDDSQFYTTYPVARSTAYKLWANSLVHLNDLDGAEKILKKGLDAFSLGPTRSEANGIINNALGMFLMEYRQDYVQAEYYLRQAIYMSDNPEYYTHLQAAVAKQIPDFDTFNSTNTSAEKNH
ncbi:hypothetical protein TI05_04950 [Achromatium sp. WMS3]|nr:hypothetical protein TI05_04950 [Achromatium sp. WMS3]